MSRSDSTDKLEVVVMFLEDGLVVHFEDHIPQREEYECGDLLQMDRGEGQFALLEPAVLLGFGKTEIEAIRKADNYFQRVARWHGHDNASQIFLFGHDVTQTMQEFSQRVAGTILSFVGTSFTWVKLSELPTTIRNAKKRTATTTLTASKHLSSPLYKLKGMLS